MKKSILVFMALIVLIISACTVQQPVSVQEKKEFQGSYKIGVLMPLTGDGAFYGIPMQASTILAMNEINSDKGILGKKLKLVFEDGKCTPRDAISAAQKLINVDDVKIVIGGCMQWRDISSCSTGREKQSYFVVPWLWKSGHNKCRRLHIQEFSL